MKIVKFNKLINLVLSQDEFSYLDASHLNRFIRSGISIELSDKSVRISYVSNLDNLRLLHQCCFFIQQASWSVEMLERGLGL